MGFELQIPDKLATMTLPETVLFPQAMIPVFIFEPRYCEMVRDVLSKSRLLAVACIDISKASTSSQFEPPCSIGTVGMVRVCQTNPDGTYQMIIQGLGRVQFRKIVQEDPYRITEIEALRTLPGLEKNELNQLKKTLIKELEYNQELGGDLPQEIFQLLSAVQDPQAFLDLAIFSLCREASLKQILLETLNDSTRYDLFINFYRRMNEKLSLEKKLSGDNGSDDFPVN